MFYLCYVFYQIHKVHNIAMCVFICSIVYEIMEDPLVRIYLYVTQMKKVFSCLVRRAFKYQFCIYIIGDGGCRFMDQAIYFSAYNLEFE